MIVSKATHLHISLLICRGGVSQVQWTLPLAARSLTFRPRVHCCVAWYNALPAHLPSKIERVQMRALRIIYLWKLYSLFKSLDLRTGAVSSVWALWKYLQKAGPCQPVMKQHLSIYFIYLFNTYSILQCLKTRRKNSYWFAKHFFGIKRLQFLAILVSNCPHHLPVYAGLKIWKGGVHGVKIMTHTSYVAT